ncbi:hypothetical protein BUALT_Bualt19G0043900 [Buddleja alternifolia]|uniref:Uncharacterized protein n=1 Tax=Buddleja alternifolia TaxID=168488 RepID=A0AAV6W1B5_9LAMI|nr:hypothetical protein BUALT_Bualt19G0043900 [Buddleja alternifolia]
MVLLSSLKFPHKREHYHLHHNPEPLSASLHNFRSKISNFLNQISTGKKSEFISLEWFRNCFEVINIANKSFAKLVVEIKYPMKEWGGKATEEYLNYTLNMLNLLNSITSSLSHLNQLKNSSFHALTLIEHSHSPEIKKIPNFKLKAPIRIIEEIRACSEKESAIVEALIVLKRIGLLTLGLVISGLCGDRKPYLEIRKFVGGFEDSLVKSFDSRFSEEIVEIKVGVTEEVNCAAARVCNGGLGEGGNELKRRLENLIEGIEKMANNLFSEVLGSRNKLLDNIRFIV